MNFMSGAEFCPPKVHVETLAPPSVMVLKDGTFGRDVVRRVQTLMGISALTEDAAGRSCARLPLGDTAGRWVPEAGSSPPHRLNLRAPADGEEYVSC